MTGMVSMGELGVHEAREHSPRFACATDSLLSKLLNVTVEDHRTN